MQNQQGRPKQRAQLDSLTQDKLLSCPSPIKSRVKTRFFIPGGEMHSELLMDPNQLICYLLFEKI